MVEPPDQPFRLIKTIRRGSKMMEGGFMYTVQRRIGDVVHWQCKERGTCEARIHTKDTDIVKRTNEHTHAPDDKSVSGCETKVGIKREARESHYSAHHIVGESLQTASAPVQPTTLAELALPAVYQQAAKGEQFSL
ncbi:hypothetical protein LOD99_3959 [Oopsacas minuta]|uniref:FLYWCH-type domain-containing protein n=1 Tax=Oopsacas minuta TaxID=111878 RepID=A0AAV7JWJ1_9METZ|nr:hypothetical protein LOD99_3959 [Oopsacas minuta]